MALRVLIVDDSPLVTDALRLLFETTGHDVAVAHSVGEAVAACADATIDLMLLDVRLDRESGLTVLETLTDVARPRVTVALTGDDDPNTVERCHAAGCREVLMKPISPGVLMGRVHEWMKEA